MPRGPIVTVLMAVHNDLRFLPEAVGSILGQSFADFEFLIVDDACSDGCSEFLGSVSDERVRVLRNPANLGLTRSMNIGLDEARGGYVARIDADDVAEPERLARQVEFLDKHPRVGLLGTARTLIDESGNTIANTQAAAGRLDVLWKMLLGNAFAHPTVMLRRDVLDRHALRYDETFETAQDYELWVRLLQHTDGANLAEPLLRYRLRDGISRTRRVNQLANHDRIAHMGIKAFLPEVKFTAGDVAQLRGRFGGFSVRDPAMDPNDARWREIYLKIRDAFAARYGSAPAVAAAA